MSPTHPLPKAGSTFEVFVCTLCRSNMWAFLSAKMTCDTSRHLCDIRLQHVRRTIRHVFPPYGFSQRYHSKWVELSALRFCLLSQRWVEVRSRKRDSRDFASCLKGWSLLTNSKNSWDDACPKLFWIKGLSTDSLAIRGRITLWTSGGRVVPLVPGLLLGSPSLLERFKSEVAWKSQIWNKRLSFFNYGLNLLDFHESG